MKRCSRCGETKSESAFSRNRAKRDGLNSYCRECHRVLRRKHYESNRDKVIDQVSTRRKQLTDEIRRYKSSKGCSVCGESHVACLDLHHRDPSTKGIEKNVLGRTGWGPERVKEELEKCEVLCANCHRKLHYDSKG